MPLQKPLFIIPITHIKSIERVNLKPKTQTTPGSQKELNKKFFFKIVLDEPLAQQHPMYLKRKTAVTDRIVKKNCNVFNDLKEDEEGILFSE